MSVLRTTYRSPLLAARMAYAAPRPIQLRQLCASSAAYQALPARNWAAAAPRDGASSGGNDRRRPRNRTDASAGQGQSQGQGSGGNANRQRRRDGGVPRRDGAQGGQSSRGVTGASGGGGSGQGHRGGGQNKGRGGGQGGQSNRGGGGGGARPFGLRGQQRDGELRMQPGTKWDAPATKAASLGATNWGRALGKDAAGAVGGDEHVFTPRMAQEDMREAASEFVEDRRADREDRHGRPRHRSGDSRSLLHAKDGEYELPSARHRSDRRKGAARGRGGGGGERFNKREWVLDEDADEELQRMEALKKLQAEKATKAKAKAQAKAAATRDAAERDVYIPTNISISKLAEKFGVRLSRLQRAIRGLGLAVDASRADYLLSADDATSLALEFNLNPIIDSDRGYDLFPQPEEDLSQCPLRPPVVTIMGHVDHGKTTLLDALRHTSVAAGEAGGITQHIGAFSVPLSSLQKAAADSDATITFLDTPGHAAFTGMRARGASVTDIIVLVVAADDGVMPQTKEVIELARREQDTVGLVVAINKCDKPMIDIDRVKQALGTESIILEEDGGEVPSVRVSGLTRTGLDDLVETLATLAEVRDLRARTEGQAEGYVLEANVTKGLGAVATVLVTRGTLRTNSTIVAGQTWARVRTMTDSSGNTVEEAGPGTPVSITGWRDVPTAGDQLLEAPSEAKAKKCIENRARDAERVALAEDAMAINIRRQEDRERLDAEKRELEAAKESGANVSQALHNARRAADEAASSGRKELRLVIKADMSGTVEAVVGSLSSIGNREVGVKVVHTGVGDVTDSDVMLAEAADGIVVAFNVECPRPIQSVANEAGVDVAVNSVIYRLIEDVRSRVAGLLPPKTESRVTGEATVQQLFPIRLGNKKTRNIAGCKVTNGTISRNHGVRVLRGSERKVVFEGTMDTLKQVKKDVTEMRKGTECGVGVEDFNDFEVGDYIVSFESFEVPQELS